MQIAQDEFYYKVFRVFEYRNTSNCRWVYTTMSCILSFWDSESNYEVKFLFNIKQFYKLQYTKNKQ